MKFAAPLFVVPSTVAAWVMTSSSFPFRSLAGQAPLHASSNCRDGSIDDGWKSRAGIRILGVCGGIGSGKSFVCQTLVNDLGCLAHLEADVIAHQVYEPNTPAGRDIAQVFGSQILTEDGHVNRKRLGDIVFSSPDQMSRLERIVWPHVKTEIQKVVGSYRALDLPPNETSVLVLEAAVLIDAGWDDLLDGLWVVTAPEDQAMNRLQTQRGFTAEDARTRITAQQSTACQSATRRFLLVQFSS